MRRLESALFSGTYAVRELTAADADAVFALYRTNPQYFAYCGEPAQPETVERDMTLRPPGTGPEQKYFLGYYENGALLAVMDITDGYPDADTAYIGLFMVDGARSGEGLGTRLIEELCAYLGGAGVRCLRLAYETDNPQAAHFWRKNGFAPLRRVSHPYGEMTVARRMLSQG